MDEKKPSYEELEKRLSRAEETLDALRKGEVDVLLGESFPFILKAKEAEDALKMSQKTLEAIVETVPSLIILTDKEGSITLFNRACEELTGYRRNEVIGRKVQDLFIPDEWISEVKKNLSNPLNPSFINPRHNPIITKSGNECMIEWRWIPISFPEAKEYFILGSGIDITERERLERERRELENQARQAQKMEAIGRLAAGIAHDFNNMLTVIIGYAEIAKGSLDSNSPIHYEFDEIIKSANKASDLTRKLLTFARQQAIEPKVIDLNWHISESHRMIQRIVGEDIELRFYPGEDLWRVKIDPSQIDQILFNLAANARDAIEGHGQILIETQNRIIDEDYCRLHMDIKPGQYVMMAFTDSGKGIEKDLIDQIFEPFFTTKKAGEGTGLGLSTVYGIVKQNMGFINVYSEIGQGTTFKIYFPRHEGQEIDHKIEEKVNKIHTSPLKTILIVEDERQILDLCIDFLERRGYRVISASHPNEAISICQTHEGDIDILLTDVVMPDMDGRELMEKVQAIRPGIKTIFMSGYTKSRIFQHKILKENGVDFIQKPFSLKDLERKIQEVTEKGDL